MKRLMTLLVMLILSLTVNGQNNEKEIELSSKFIIDLIEKVEWPESAGRDSFVINVIGDNRFVPILRSMADTGRTGGKKIIINSVTLEDKFDECQMIFIATDSLSRLAKILKKVEKKPVLTVSMHGTFARYGVMVNIREIKNNKIKYAINNMTAHKSNLKISEDLRKKAVETFG